MIQEISSCRACKCGILYPVFSLGDQYVTDFPPPGKEKDGLLAPLELILCQNCSLLQLKHTVARDEMYRQYWYKSGMNQTMRDALKDIVETAQKFTLVSDNDEVIDIGSNDGTLLSYYHPNIRRIGYEPARNIWKESVQNVEQYRSYNDYFTYHGHNAKVITAIAMFYDLDNPDEFLRNVYLSLDSDGIFIIQQNYLVTMLENNTFDNISHEHLCYYSLTSLTYLLEQNNLEVIDVEENDINGGSFRTYIRRKTSHAQRDKMGLRRVQEMLMREAQLGLNSPDIYEQFFTRINTAKNEMHEFIVREKESGKTFFLYGASTRGHVILQFYGLDNTLISGAAERNPDKYGLVTIGTGIPILSEAEVRAHKPDYMLVLPYAFKNEFIEREQEYLSQGGALLFPLPKFEIVEKVIA